MNLDVSQFSYLLNDTSRDWRLLKAPQLAGGYCVFNRKQSSVLLIECEEINEQVCKILIEKGREVLLRLPK
jgi:hypothetical protein